MIILRPNNRAFFYMLWQYWGNENKKPITTEVIGYIVETAGFEPASKGPDTNVSTCVVCLKI